MEIEKIMFGSAVTSDEKIDEVQRIRDHLRRNPVDESILTCLQELATDKDADVRCEVAFCLALLPPEDLHRFTHLLTDCNTFVASKAQEVINRSTTERRRTETLKRLEEQTLKGIEYFRTQFGDEAAKMARETAEEAYAQAVGHAAHDLRGVIAQMELEVSDMYSASINELPAQKRNRVNRANNNFKARVEMSYRILEDMKIYARKTPDDRMPENLGVLLNASITQATSDFSVQVKNADEVKVVSDVPDTLSVYVSTLVIQRAFSNLIKNAMESYLTSAYKTKAGTVEISAEKVQDGVRIVIRDHGMGFTKKGLISARTFLPRSTSKKTTGSGFGLAIAYSKIKDHGGSLNIDSEGPGEGTTVTIFLPSKGETK